MLNIKLALRTLFKSPFVTVVAVVSLALGIGANTAIFSLFHEFVLRSLPVGALQAGQPLRARPQKPGSQSCNQAGDCDVVFSYPMFRDLERVQATFTGIAGAPSVRGQPRLPGTDIERRGRVRFRKLLSCARHAARARAAPRSGRRSFGRRVSGRGAQPRVVAVPVRRRSERPQRDDHRQRPVADDRRRGAAGLHGHDARRDAAGVRRPSPCAASCSQGPGPDDRRTYWVYTFARLKPGVSLDQAKTAINVPYRQIVNDVEAPLQQGMSDQTMARFKAKGIEMEEGWRGRARSTAKPERRCCSSSA